MDRDVAAKLLALMILFVTFLAIPAIGQEVQPPEQSTTQNPQTAAASLSQPQEKIDFEDFGSLWKLTELGGGIRWAIFFVFGLAILFIVNKLYEIWRDAIRSKKLENINFDEASLEAVRDLRKASKKSLLSELLSKQFDVYKNTQKPEILHEELNAFVTLQQENFNRFKNRMNFLSDTAGALGLLGTVYGMFITFYGGDLDTQRILNGMGVALITTLLGLVVSIVINFASTEVSNFFSRRLSRIFTIADFIRMRFFANVEDSSTYETAVANGATAKSLPGRAEPIDLRLKSVTKLVQSAPVGKHLSKPFTVQTINKFGVPISGAEVVFEVQGSGGLFADNQKSIKIISNKKGHAEATFLLSPDVGKRTVVAHAAKNPKSEIVFQVHGIAGPPAKLDHEEGNHQTAKVNQALNRPFVISLSDAFGNPISDKKIAFTIVQGDGQFANLDNNEVDDTNGHSQGLKSVFKKKNAHNENVFEVETDDFGRAEAQLILGPDPGVNQVSAVARSLPKSPVTFEAMGQAEEAVHV